MESEPPLLLRGGRSIRWTFLLLIPLLITFFPLKVIHEESRSCPSVSGKPRLTIEGNANPETAEMPLRDLSPTKKSRKDKHFHGLILAASSKHSVDPALVKAIIMAESSYNPDAISRKGAVGLMQLMPGTAVDMGVEDSFDPEHNINGGVKYLKHLLNLFQGDLRLAVAAYNAGITKVKKYQGVPPYKSTQFYVAKVFKYYRHYKSRM